MISPDLAETVKRLREPRAFPVLGEHAFVPWFMVMEHEAQALANHGGQTVAGLAGRGGLSWCELCAVLENRRYQEMDQKQAIARVVGHTVKWLTASSSSILDALEGLEKRERAYGVLVGQIIKALGEHEDDDLSLDENVAKIVSSLAEARKGARTAEDGISPRVKCPVCGSYGPDAAYAAYCTDSNCPIKRAQHPTAPQETAP